jgi:predicted DNA binding protein
MKILKKKDLTELVGGDMYSDGNDQNVIGNSEIQTGPTSVTYDNSSDYQKGTPLTTDKVASRYRQNIPWFAVYSYGSNSSTGMIRTFESKTVTKKFVEEKIDDLVKKSKNNDFTEKNYNPKVAKLIDTIENADLTDKQLEDLKNAIANKQVSKTIR